ncbi:MAG: type II toxin-antitoxin system VapC family toxin [Ignavibacteriae bacterium]|nr:type II toxin-antitoxin system VapC family toxin [Ignavibacteriota bacterium]
MIVVDTHIILWHSLSPNKLSNKAKRTISVANNSDGIIMSEISLWEIAMLIKKKRINIDISYLEFISLIKATNNIILKGITPEIAELSTKLDSTINADPADRIICATAITNNATLITKDNNLLKSNIVKTLW